MTLTPPPKNGNDTVSADEKWLRQVRELAKMIEALPKPKYVYVPVRVWALMQNLEIQFLSNEDELDV